MAQHETGNVGTVIQVIGPVIDVQFPEHHSPEIHNAVHITSEGFEGPSRSTSWPKSRSTWAKAACAQLR